MRPPTSSDERGDGTSARLWEEAAACGACGSRRCRFAGSIDGRRLAVCLDCEVERLYDRVAENRLDLLYGSYYAASDPSPAALERQLANPTFELRRRRLEEVLGNRARRILELGCGDGNFLAALRRTGWDVHGQEFSAETSAIVTRRHRIPMITGPLESVSPEPKFPVVAAYHVFEHIYHPAAWLQRVIQFVEPDGLLHLQVPNAASLTRRLSGDVWAGLVFPQHVYFYEPRTLQRLLNRSGFSVLATSTWDPWHGPGATATSMANVANRALSGRRPWHDRMLESPGTGAQSTSAAPAGRHPLKVLLRGGLDRVSAGLARVEAAAGRGAVVDIIARRA
jgi:2-polyprenyl-3-methyl-5-hydroxy-6-metoxy-1,4-benzoquinol methylase